MADVIVTQDANANQADRIAPWTPSGAAWGGLARDVIMWLDIYQERTPRSLLKHLDRVGAEIPMWLLDEPEMKNLDHALSKGTRAVIIYRAMLQDAPSADALTSERDNLRARDVSWSATYSHIDAAANEDARMMAAAGNLHAALSSLLIKVVALYTASAPGGNYDVGNRFADADPDVQAARAALLQAQGSPSHD